MSGEDGRRGERWGWIGGWAGAFLWLGGLAVLWVLEGRSGFAAVSVSLCALGIVTTLGVAPWRHPGVRYWKLMLPVYAVLATSIVVVVLQFSAHYGAHVPWVFLLPLAGVLSPLLTVGHRTWSGGG